MKHRLLSLWKEIQGGSQGCYSLPAIADWTRFWEGSGFKFIHQTQWFDHIHSRKSVAPDLISQAKAITQLNYAHRNRTFWLFSSRWRYLRLSHPLHWVLLNRKDIFRHSFALQNSESPWYSNMFYPHGYFSQLLDALTNWSCFTDCLNCQSLLLCSHF